MATKKYSVVDLFSGAGGMSYGFFRHPLFNIVAAADAEMGKPSSGSGRLQCNGTYRRNIGLGPVPVDLSRVSPTRIKQALKLEESLRIDVLAVCPPCTGFSRTNPNNHLEDDARNGLVRRAADFAVALDAQIVVMENARELVMGNFRHHFDSFRARLESAGYAVHGATYMLSRFGLPQIRERAIIVASRRPLPLRTLDDLWEGWQVREEATTVRAAFSAVDPDATAARLYPSFASSEVRERIASVPKDGGSWADLAARSDAVHLLTGSMKRILAAGRMGSYPDVYGRMAWDRPAPTIKRECAHVGNGRYAHPEEDRLCTVREMAMLQGFPNEFAFNGATLSNMYRHIGDAVPPLISYQLAHLCAWILSGRKPRIRQVVLAGCSLGESDLERTSQEDLFCA